MTASRLASLLRPACPEIGMNPTCLERVVFYRVDAPLACEHNLYAPALVFAAQGEKQAEVNGKHFSYSADEYLVVAVPMPMETEIRNASPAAPFLALGIEFDLLELGDLMLQANDERPLDEDCSCGVFSTPVTERINDALCRLVSALQDPQEGRILGPQICREISYLVLKGPHGDRLRAMMRLHGPSMRIASVLRHIHDNPADPIDVTQMTSMAQMSKSAFFSAFKEVTAMSPLQYQKSIRLHRARSMILNEGSLISDAAYRVGYSTASQFSRDYSRFFNKTARQDIADSAAMAS